MAPLISECYANFECRLHDASLVYKYSLFVWEVVKAHVAQSPLPAPSGLRCCEPWWLRYDLSPAFARKSPQA